MTLWIRNGIGNQSGMGSRKHQRNCKESKVQVGRNEGLKMVMQKKVDGARKKRSPKKG